MKSVIILFILSLFMFFQEAKAEKIDTLTPFFDVKGNYKTPYYKWAKPLKKPIKVFFIGPCYAMREVAEIAERVNIDYQVLITENDKQVGNKALIDEFKKRFQAAMKEDWDVVVIGRIKWDMPIGRKRVSDLILYDILKKVSQGSGLIYCGIDEMPPLFKRIFQKDSAAEILMGSIPMNRSTGMAKEFKDKALTTWSLKTGRLAYYKPEKLGRLSLVTKDPRTRLEYEFQQAFFINLLLWCAKREAGVFSISALLDKIAPRTPFSVKLDIEQNGKKTVPAKALLSIVNKYYEAQLRSPIELDLSGTNAKSQSVSIDETLPTGENFIIARIYDSEGNVLGFTSTTINISGMNLLSKTLIDKSILEPGDTLKIKIETAKLIKEKSLNLGSFGILVDEG